MHKKIFAQLLLIFVGISVVAQVQTPAAFMGYTIGTRLTPHWKIVSYFKHTAMQSPGSMKLEQYGETNEGRPLLLAYISSEENIKNLELLRQNHLRMAGLGEDNQPSRPENAPAIVWLSYNVHGNEPSSSEAALLTLYAFTNPDDSKTKEWLKNTVLIIDPCLNPDGRDRYVNWFNSAVGKHSNPEPLAREHREPWPQGRTNHYNFDLNRDWAWQTQAESRHRIKKYLQWMPHVHVDYHEQGINEPYYFAPAAEPLHEVITNWQKEFQYTIGKNHARYFDANGWLYFSRIRFDLFYPSYGDTYPVYNGSIGMTYEQGGISGGLAVVNDEGDTLTLTDRVQHHFTTSLSTVETASRHADKLVKEFHNYFAAAINNGVGEYKSYVIRYDTKDAQRLDKLLDLLDKNGIQYSHSSGTARGYNYHTGKEETFTVQKSDILISAYQPRSAMVKVLFEPASRFSDSITYDITAWSLPYAYNLRAYASKEKLAATNSVVRKEIVNPETSYGYVMPWHGIRSMKAAGEMLRKKIMLRYAEADFELNGNRFERGAVIILKTSNQEFGNLLWSTVRQIADANQVQLYPVSSGMVDKGYDFGSDMVQAVKPPSVVMITGDAISTTAAGGVWSFFEQELEYPLTQVSTNDIQRLNWSKVDILIMPDGNYRFLNDKDLLENFKAWIRKGGKVIALENAVAQLANVEIGLKPKKTEEAAKPNENKTGYEALRKFEDRERDALSGFTAGSIYKLQLDHSNPLGFGCPDYYYTLKQDDRIYEFFTENGWNVGIVKKDNQVAGFVGSRLKEKLRDGLLLGVQQYGNGSVICFTDDVLFRNFWESGKLLFCNAIFFNYH